MKRKDIIPLDINSDAFETMKRDFDKVLKTTLENMQIRGSNEAALTLKLNIGLAQIEIPDYESSEEGATRIIYKPRIDHKVNSVMSIKSEESGRLSGEYELAWDNFRQNYVLKPIDDDQIDLFDEEN